jgi:hypothetical protein
MSTTSRRRVGSRIHVYTSKVNITLLI